MENILSEQIDHHIVLGRINSLAVTRIIEFGVVLRNHNGDEEVLLPNAYVTEEMKQLGHAVEVFIYTDSEDRLVASTQKPLAIEGEYGYFEVVDFKSYGAFVDWGLPKDLFVPLSHQKGYMQIGKKYILRIAVDEQTNRLYGSQKVGKWLEDPYGMVPSQRVDALIIAKTPMGYKVIVENRFEGMIYDNEIFENISIGDRRNLYVKAIRADKKLDLSLQPLGKQAKNMDATKRIISKLQESNGRLEVTSKSSPELIEELFGLSKKVFKGALNALIEDGSIKLSDGVILLS